MQKFAKLIAIIVAMLLVLSYSPITYAQSSTFQLSSPVLTDGGVFKTEQVANTFGCSGGGISPELSWKGAPDGTKSFALNIYDADAPTGSGFWHWVIFNIPATVTSLPAGAGDPAKKLAPAGSVQSMNDSGTPGYIGPCPPEGDAPHRYLFTLFALKTDKIDLDQNAQGALVGFMLNANTLAKTTLTSMYGRPSTFQLSSPVLTEGGMFKTEQVGTGCSGGGVSPELSWKGAPDGTKSFALNIHDADAPTGSGFWHWTIFNIPATVTSLPAGAGDPAKKLAPAGSVQSLNDTGTPGYIGPCPPQGDKPHHCLFTLFALKTDKIDLDQNAPGALAGFMLNGNALAKAYLTSTYGR